MGDDANGDDERPGWVDRHLGKILVAAAVVCALGLIGRALSG